MSSPADDLAQVRLNNALALFDEFVRATAKHADAATLRGLERRFAERIQIQPSYWSQIKSRSRHIGERLARQFEQLCHKPRGWMDEAQHRPVREAPQAGAGEDAASWGPRDDDERFIVGLVLTYYRRHPQRARTRLLDLLGEVLDPRRRRAGASAEQGSNRRSRCARAVSRRGACVVAAQPGRCGAVETQALRSTIFCTPRLHKIIKPLSSAQLLASLGDTRPIHPPGPHMLHNALPRESLSRCAAAGLLAWASGRGLDVSNLGAPMRARMTET